MERDRIFNDRADAGRRLAAALGQYVGRDDVVVLGLPRGGLPVAWEIARALHAPLDILIVRKVGVPGHRELAMGAIASGGVRVYNEEVIRQLRIRPEQFEAVARQEEQELERRERAYRGGRPRPELAGRIVIIVDDGMATGSTMHAGVRALRGLNPARIVVAVPHAPPDTCHALGQEADEIVCLSTPEPYIAVGRWYRDFGQLGDGEVRELLEQAATAHARHTAAAGTAPN
jgi:predicted phosphoribosyltransferase